MIIDCASTTDDEREVEVIRLMVEWGWCCRDSCRFITAVDCRWRYGCLLYFMLSEREFSRRRRPYSQNYERQSYCAYSYTLHYL